MAFAEENGEVVISCDERIAEFKEYVDSNQRCILSAGFGDGKSYFLNKYMDSTQDEYIYIPIYPVNYQVAENKDIFEYIKRDILIEQLAHGEEYIDNENFNKLLLLQFYMMNKPGEIIENLIDVLPSVDIGHIRIEPGKVVKSIKKLRSDFTAYAKPFENDEKKSDDFVNSFSNVKGGIYEFDPVSQLICAINNKLRRKLSKKIVLIIEDLDRIDPAHIFRILNIFSAHFDGNFSN